MPDVSAEDLANLDKGLARTLGFVFEETSADRVVIGMEIAQHVLQPYGIVHGGVYCSLVETAASVGAAVWFGDRGQVVGVANHTDFLRATREGRVTATATPIHRGRTQQLWLVEIHEAGGKLAARGEVRLQNIAADKPLR